MSAENCIAKNSLMNDDDDTDSRTNQKSPIKQEPDVKTHVERKKPRIGPKSKLLEAKLEHPDSLMLTADKMMNKELNLLHAPVVLKDENDKTLPKGPSTRNKMVRNVM